MKVAQDIIIKPIITEATMTNMGLKKYTFKVDKNANKIEIGKAIEQLFGVKVSKVNTMNVRGKEKRVGAHKGFTSDWKKAIVTLKPDSKGIEFFDSMN